MNPVHSYYENNELHFLATAAPAGMGKAEPFEPNTFL
jgi:hypothetical protein